MQVILIRHEAPHDAQAVKALNREAFGGPLEAELVARLRADGLVACSLVAARRQRSWATSSSHGSACTWTTTRCGRAAALAPMAVAPSSQRRGIGSRLVEAGLREVRAAGADAVVVLGHPAFYPRFGFSARRAVHLASPFAGDAFMAIDLRGGALDGVRASVTYPPAFSL
jgi:putative acetyltransferase